MIVPCEAEQRSPMDTCEFPFMLSYELFTFLVLLNLDLRLASYGPWPASVLLSGFVRMALNFLIAEDNQKENDSSRHMEII